MPNPDRLATAIEKDVAVIVGNPEILVRLRRNTSLRSTDPAAAKLAVVMFRGVMIGRATRQEHAREKSWDPHPSPPIPIRTV